MSTAGFNPASSLASPWAGTRCGDAEMPRAHHADTRVKTVILRRGLQISMVFGWSFGKLEHPTCQRSCSHQTWRPIHRTDRRLPPPTKIICRARAEALQALGPACAALVLWRSGARIGRTGAQCFEAFKTLPRLVCSVDCARLRWNLLDMRTWAHPGLRSIPLEISIRSLRVNGQAYSMPRNKPRKDEFSSGGQ